MIQTKKSIEQIERHLADVISRKPENSLDSEITRLAVELKRQAVKNNDQALAKALWCYQAVQRCQNRYIHSYYDMKEGYFYGAWCALEKIENMLDALEHHFDLDVNGEDSYKLLQIRKNTEQFQRLFPYKLFNSIGAVVHETKCSICDQPVSLRKPCGHRAGEIYSGEACFQVVTKADLLEVSLVERPVQKCTVPFIVDKNTGKTVDHYNYVHIHYAIDNLEDPFTEWNLTVKRKMRLTSDFADVGRNDDCPCGSTKKFKKCCMRKKYLMRNHFNIGLPNRPDEHLPTVLDKGIVRGKPRFPFENTINGT